ncbi:MAG: hypothetical protein Rubg2KO_41120 [Rubricoccaceae bacterium]
MLSLRQLFTISTPETGTVRREVSYPFEEELVLPRVARPCDDSDPREAGPMAAREVWAKRVRRWVESDQTTVEFASALGINPLTLKYWKWKLRKERHATTVRVTRRLERQDRADLNAGIAGA